MVGIVHTNYLAYSSGYSVWGPVLTFMLRWVRMHAYLRCFKAHIWFSAL